MGKMNVQIPWETLKQDPFKWIKVSCYPKHFVWRDPSKIRIEDTFKLLAHWRKRISEGKKPLTWIKTCDLFKDVPGVVRPDRMPCLDPTVEQEPSEENYDLNVSGVEEEDEEDDEGSADSSSSGTDADAEIGQQSSEEEDSDASSGSDAEEDHSDGMNTSDTPDSAEHASDTPESAEHASDTPHSAEHASDTPHSAEHASDAPTECENQGSDSGSAGHISQHPGEYYSHYLL